MLNSLSIRDVVLIDRLDLDCRPGLSVLTGETGAGKSILLDALGLALGQRADAGLVRAGCTQAGVTAVFEVRAEHPAHLLLLEHGLEPDAGDSTIVMRRQVGADGRSRGFINDVPVNARLMRDVADRLIEIDGQFEAQGLLDPKSHRDLLDAYAEAGDERARVAETHRAWRTALVALQDRQAQIERLAEERDHLAASIAELEQLAPLPGESEQLAGEREMLMHQEQIIAAFNEALDAVEGNDASAGVLDRLRTAQARLDRVADKAGAGMQPALEALDRAMIETEEAIAGLQAFGSKLEAEPDRLEHVDDRLYALRSAARKFDVGAGDLPALAQRMQDELRAVQDRGAAIAQLDAQAEKAHKQFAAACRALSNRRSKAAQDLAAAVMRELPALRLDRAKFTVALTPRAEDAWAADGAEEVRFLAATNPGTQPGPLHKVASGGELSRFMLALKVVLAHAGTVQTLVFDEVDSGVGGATAAAVGERLALLAEDLQVLVVTHSPQVAARGNLHWRVLKRAAGATTTTTVEVLTGDERLEEVARMLSGAEITAEARGAAARLLELAA